MTWFKRAVKRALLVRFFGAFRGVSGGSGWSAVRSKDSWGDFLAWQTSTLVVLGKNLEVFWKHFVVFCGFLGNDIGYFVEGSKRLRRASG